MESGKSLHSNQQLIRAKDKIVDDLNSNRESSNKDIELDFLPRSEKILSSVLETHP